MKPPLPPGESIVPQTLHAQLEIAKAMRTLMVPDEAELLYRRRAEIAAIRGELEAIKRDFQKAGEECLALVKAELRAALAGKYNPNQPRVPAGNRGGGQWTDGSEAGGETSSDHSDDGTGDAHSSPIRYAHADTNTRTDATEVRSKSIGTAEQDIEISSNLRSVLYTILTRNDPQRRRIWSFQLPADNPRSAVDFTDSDGVPIHDSQGYPILRPANMPPERYLQAADLAAHYLDEYKEFKEGNLPDDATPGALEGFSFALLPVAPGGSLDAERFDFTRVNDYRHYLNIMIGVYGAKLGLGEDEVLCAVDFYARFFSTFKEQKDEVYTHSAKQDVEDTKRGYELYLSGRIRLENE
jgi:hypothetical protein